MHQIISYVQIGGYCLLSCLIVSLQKQLIQLVNVDTELVDGFPNTALVACVLEVWLDENVANLFLAGDSKVFFIHVIFLSSLSEIPCINCSSPVDEGQVTFPLCSQLLDY